MLQRGSPWRRERYHGVVTSRQSTTRLVVHDGRAHDLRKISPKAVASMVGGALALQTDAAVMKTTFCEGSWAGPLAWKSMQAAKDKLPKRDANALPAMVEGARAGPKPSCKGRASYTTTVANYACAREAHCSTGSSATGRRNRGECNGETPLLKATTAVQAQGDGFAEGFVRCLLPWPAEWFPAALHNDTAAVEWINRPPGKRLRGTVFAEARPGELG